MYKNLVTSAVSPIIAYSAIMANAWKPVLLWLVLLLTSIICPITIYSNTSAVSSITAYSIALVASFSVVASTACPITAYSVTSALSPSRAISVSSAAGLSTAATVMLSTPSHS